VDPVWVFFLPLWLSFMVYILNQSTIAIMVGISIYRDSLYGNLNVMPLSYVAYEIMYKKYV